MLKVLTCTDFKNRINECFHMAVLCKQTHKELADRLDMFVRKELNRKTGKAKPKCVYSAYVHGYVRACIEVATDSLYRNEFEFLYIVDGVYYSTGKEESIHRKTEEFYASNRGCELSGAPSGHYWKGSEKPFFSAESI